MTRDFSSLVVSESNSVRNVISCIDKNGKGIAIVLDDDQHLIATVTDGDIRRAILAGIDVDLPVSELLKRRTNVSDEGPITARLARLTPPCYTSWPRQQCDTFRSSIRTIE